MIDNKMNGDTSTLIRLRNSSIRHRMQVYRVQGVCGSAILHVVLLYYCTRIIVQRYRRINTNYDGGCRTASGVQYTTVLVLLYYYTTTYGYI